MARDVAERPSEDEPASRTSVSVTVSVEDNEAEIEGKGSGAQLPDPDAFSGADKHGINPGANRFPFCIVWTPIPLLTWLLPFVGHMGICTSKGIIRDFAGPYFVGTNHMAFGRPTRYLLLDASKVSGGAAGWDGAVSEASEIYSRRIHNIFCDNCHSHVATALDIMAYDARDNWNMVTLCFDVFFKAKFVGVGGCLRTFLPWFFTTFIIALFIVLTALYS